MDMELIKTILIFSISGYKVTLWVAIISSWFPKFTDNTLCIKLIEIANITCDPIRKILKSRTIDLSPMIVFLILTFIQTKLAEISLTGI